MMRIPLLVTYTDGTTAAVTATQYAVGQWAQHCARNGLPLGRTAMTEDSAMGVAMLRFMAYAELARDQNGKFPAFPAWDRGVDEVAGEGEPEAVDPTRAGPGDSSP